MSPVQRKETVRTTANPSPDSASAPETSQATQSAEKGAERVLDPHELDLSLKGLLFRRDYAQAMYSHRFDGLPNKGAKAMTLVWKGKRFREAAEKNLAEASRLLSTVKEAGDVLEPSTAQRISDLVEDVISEETIPAQGKVMEHKRGVLRQGDAVADNLTEYVASNGDCIGAMKVTELYNDHLVAKGGRRLDEPSPGSWLGINWGGQIKEFVFKTAVYFLGIAGARGRQFYSNIDKDTLQRKTDLKFPGIELLGSVWMVAGSVFGSRVMENHVTPRFMRTRFGQWCGRKYRGTAKLFSSLVASAVSGFSAGYIVYWLAGKYTPKQVNSSPLKGAIRATGNVVLRQGIQPLMQSKRSRDRDALADAPVGVDGAT